MPVGTIGHEKKIRTLIALTSWMCFQSCKTSGVELNRIFLAVKWGNMALRLHSLCIPQGGGGADDFEAGSQLFWRGARGDVEIFHDGKRGVPIFFFNLSL